VRKQVVPMRWDDPQLASVTEYSKQYSSIGNADRKVR